MRLSPNGAMRLGWVGGRRNGKGAVRAKLSHKVNLRRDGRSKPKGFERPAAPAATARTAPWWVHTCT